MAYQSYQHGHLLYQQRRRVYYTKGNTVFTYQNEPNIYDTKINLAPVIPKGILCLSY